MIIILNGDGNCKFDIFADIFCKPGTLHDADCNWLKLYTKPGFGFDVFDIFAINWIC